jgi:hypothetical protein
LANTYRQWQQWGRFLKGWNFSGSKKAAIRLSELRRDLGFGR